MRRRLLLPLLLALACDSGTSAPATAVVELRIPAPADLPAQSVSIRLQGPTPRQATTTPGQTVRIEDVELGRYDVTIEARTGNQVVWYFETTAQIAEGE